MLDTKENYKAIADWITDIGIEKTTTGNYYVDFDAIFQKFAVTEDWLYEHFDDICSEFDPDIVCEYSYDEDKSFDILFFTQAVCDRCDTYISGQKCADNCDICDCWEDEFEDEDAF